MKTVYAYVVADLLHYGHVRHLRDARDLGDRLVVGILSDEACMEKKARPIMPFWDRVEVVQHLECVDAVVTQNFYSPLFNLKRGDYDILAESTSHKDQPANAWCEANGIEVVVLPYTKEISSTMIKRRILDAHKKDELFKKP